ncbi:hypothetical protein O7634_13510 [Micromonospora sp. WMMD1120]|uniref:hypothetical protein n=1 Tax=Micromonospora sp. WMMD1120 TaxID=3016106 RepID=UPI00241756F9|nr:hypothetical protein [Micromonospora sp. WMMD1120]MDG4807767.1 hypothetical protein [Micromonospora sp. WMMD1120]
MRYVSVERTNHGVALDPEAYLLELPSLAESLPEGAGRFATDPDHYDFFGQRCVKDLKPARLTSGETDGGRWLELYLRHNCWKHEEDLTIRYSGVRSLTIEPDDQGLGVVHLQDVMLDEVLPHEHGCQHEIVCLSGRLIVTSRDLAAAWRYADCAERAPTQ